jgi:hypothetical protein
MEFEVGVSEDGHVSPMMESVVEGLRAGSPHEHLTTFPTLLCNGSNTAKVSQGDEVSEPNSVMSVCEDRREDEGTDTGQRSKDGGVGGLFAFGRQLNLPEPSFEVLIGVPTLTPNE